MVNIPFGRLIECCTYDQIWMKGSLIFSIMANICYFFACL
ncbi:hypothetical protein [uncultured Gammaproteobacteria bacterium]|nr:hypothetical protein [uncultured Gammaproteobacteria bacterium]